MTAPQLGKVQLRIMQLLWRTGQATARELTESLNDAGPIAHSTVQTLLRGLEEKAAVAHKKEGRTFLFYPLVDEDKYQQSATRDLVKRVFDGNVGDLVNHLLKHERVSREELDEIRRMIDDYDQKQP